MYISDELVLSPTLPAPCTRLGGVKHVLSEFTGLAEVESVMEGVMTIETNLVGRWQVCHNKDNTL